MAIPNFKRLIDHYTEPGARHAFELMCNGLLVTEFPGTAAIRANPGDGGIDCLGRAVGGGHVVYQVKYFPRDFDASQKDQIRTSFGKAKETLQGKMTAWILLVPKDLDLDEESWFDTWAGKQTDVEIELWGEARLRELLGKYPHIEERYFGTGTAAILRQIVVQQDEALGQQGELITTLREGIETLKRSEPKLRVAVLTPDGIVDELRLRPPQVEEPRPLSDSALDEFIGRWADLIGEDVIREACESYQEARERYIDKIDDIRLETQVENASSFVVFAVVNSGQAPAKNISVWVDFPSELIAWDDIRPRGEKIPDAPTWPEARLHRRAEEAQRSRDAEKRREASSNRPRRLSHLMPGHDESLHRAMQSLQGLDRQPLQAVHKSMRQLTEGLAGAIQPYPWHDPAESAFSLSLVERAIDRSERRDVKPVRNEIKLHEDGSQASFWFKKIKHGGMYDRHLGGIWACLVGDSGTVLTYEIVADNVPTTVMGTIPVIADPGAEPVEEWDPFE